MTLDTKEVTPLTTGAYEDWAPQFSPDGGSVVFSRRAKDSMAHVYLVDAGGGEARAITADEEVYDVGPVFLPDGETILFARLSEAPKWGPDYDASWERRSLYTISRDGQGLARVARRYDGKEHWARRATAEHPVVTSYAGNLVLCDPEAVSALRASGVPEVPVGDWVDELGAYTKCVFSRDGQRVAFTTCRRSGDDGCEYSLRVAATGAKQSQVIVKKPCEIRDVAFSPDGARLVFVARTRVSAERDHYELWTVRFDGTDLRRLPVSEEERKDMEKEERREQRKETQRSQSAAVFVQGRDTSTFDLRGVNQFWM
jgi:Tol biopolymer transport system component